MEIINETRKEDEKYFQGPFWIISDSLVSIHEGNFKLVEEKFLCDYNGNCLEDTTSRFQKTYQFPRGHVIIREGKAFIYLNSKVNIVKVIDQVIKDYCLDKLEVHIEENDSLQVRTFGLSRRF